jgi:hypothetical protein
VGVGQFHGTTMPQRRRKHELPKPLLGGGPDVAELPQIVATPTSLNTVAAR